MHVIWHFENVYEPSGFHLKPFLFHGVCSADIGRLREELDILRGKSTVIKGNIACIDLPPYFVVEAKAWTKVGGGTPSGRQSPSAKVKEKY